MINYETIGVLALVTVGLTEAVKNQVPSFAKFAPFIAFFVGIGVYYSYLYLPTDFLTLMYLVGGSMGLFTISKTIGTITVK